jgi:hypothetical protein
MCGPSLQETLVGAPQPDALFIRWLLVDKVFGKISGVRPRGFRKAVKAIATQTVCNLACGARRGRESNDGGCGPRRMRQIQLIILCFGMTKEKPALRRALQIGDGG